MKFIIKDIDFFCYYSEDNNLSEYKKDPNSLEYYEKEDYIRLLREINEISKINKCIFYVKNENAFYQNGQKIDIENKIILPRGKIKETPKIIKAVTTFGRKSLVTIYDREIIENWCDYIKTKRPIFKTTFAHFKENCEKNLKQFNQIFFKTVKKKFSGIIEIAQYHKVKQNTNKQDGNKLDASNILKKLLSNSKSFSDDRAKERVIKELDTKKERNIEQCEDLSNIHTIRYLGEIDNNFFIKLLGEPSMFSLKDEEKVMFGPCVEICKDNNGKREWRSVIINNKLHSISRYPNDKYVFVEEKVYNYANSVISQLEKNNNFPLTFVLDIIEIKDNNTNETYLDICEFNDLTASGLNEFNDLSKDYYNNFSNNLELTKK